MPTNQCPYPNQAWPSMSTAAVRHRLSSRARTRHGRRRTPENQAFSPAAPRQHGSVICARPPDLILARAGSQGISPTGRKGTAVVVMPQVRLGSQSVSVSSPGMQSCTAAVSTAEIARAPSHGSPHRAHLTMTLTTVRRSGVAADRCCTRHTVEAVAISGYRQDCQSPRNR